jgi:predicted PurR-regulated permease PerM
MLSSSAGAMPESTSRRTAVEIPWRTILKLVAAAALVWVWLQLVQLCLVLIVAVLLAVALNPIVAWLERRGWPRWGAAFAVCLALLVLLGGFGWLTWSSVSHQAQDASGHISQMANSARDKLPGWVRNASGMTSGQQVNARAATYAVRLGRSAIAALVVAALGYIITMYLLIEGQRTRDWLIAFVPEKHRRKAEQTLSESERVIFAYVAGNVLTSVCATIFVFVLLTAAKVPAALLLALVAGLFDFVPVLGFIVSGVFAVLMAATVSGTAALVVGVGYVAYHGIENYVLAPWAYGDRLKLSNLAVILAFAVGAELAGVIGALIALPVAAVYPAIERIWLRDRLADDTVREHKALARRA